MSRIGTLAVFNSNNLILIWLNFSNPLVGTTSISVRRYLAKLFKNITHFVATISFHTLPNVYDRRSFSSSQIKLNLSANALSMNVRTKFQMIYWSFNLLWDVIPKHTKFNFLLFQKARNIQSIQSMRKSTLYS